MSELCAYYYSFDHTGCPQIDKILAAVASAGDGYHNTEGWNTGNPSPVDVIQDAAWEAAEYIADIVLQSNKSMQATEDRA